MIIHNIWAGSFRRRTLLAFGIAALLLGLMGSVGSKGFDSGGFTAHATTWLGARSAAAADKADPDTSSTCSSMDDDADGGCFVYDGGGTSGGGGGTGTGTGTTTGGGGGAPDGGTPDGGWGGTDTGGTSGGNSFTPCGIVCSAGGSTFGQCGRLCFDPDGGSSFTPWKP